MREPYRPLSTGWPDLDARLKGVLPGDNIVWHVDCYDDFPRLVAPFPATAQGRPLIYFRFSDRPPVLPADAGAELRRLDPAEGFAPFVRRVHDTIDQVGRGALYVFDLLSDLAGVWQSDALLGNFFRLTCPHLYDLETVACFALLRGAQSADAVEPIVATAQIVLDVLRRGDRVFVRPVKTQYRYSPTITLLHEWQGNSFPPVADSGVVAEVLAEGGAGDPRQPERVEAPALVTSPRMEALLSGDDRILALAHRYMTAADLDAVRRRMIGTGRIGGKATGMLLARAILRRERPELAARLEPHDSFFVGSDVFITFLVHNGIWWMRDVADDIDRRLVEAALARHRILSGTWTARAIEGFERMVDYFGQWPFIVRSSSILEDGFGNAFAGKYDSLFCANQGPREQRIADVLAAARHIYASAMSERALRYRATRGLLNRDEQMALLVMRVSGTLAGRRLYPPVAGVGFSFNPYAWHPDIDPRAGVARIVLGLGTRAVDRSDDDYTRLVALNAPHRRPEANFDEIVRFAQRRADVVDLDANQVVSVPVETLAADPPPGVPFDLFFTGGDDGTPPVPTFDRLFERTRLAEDLRDMLRTLESVYECPVDIEFTVNFPAPDSPRIHLLQCRPLQVREGERAAPEWPADGAAAWLAVAADAVVGHSRSLPLDWVIYIAPRDYAALSLADRHALARWLGVLGRRLRETPRRDAAIALLGPGRWGTTNPFLGIPVTFAELQPASAVFEIVAMHEHLIPDASLGTHFFSDLVESDMLYAALRPDRSPNLLDDQRLRALPNLTLEVMPDAERWAGIVRVLAADRLPPPWRGLRLLADAPRQRAGILLETAGGAPPSR
ncbi:MAG: PEP/pyruvate-binding domain-containing protein [Kiritimatiellae bacterium]|nr:PEP/pyruvate-binding domain-containing protein [Kiritimatiellia bacterium]